MCSSDLKRIGLIIDDLEDDQDLQDLVLSIHHAMTHTFSGTGAVKIIENHLGKAFLKMQQAVIIQQPMPPNQPQPAPQPPNQPRP